MSPEIEAELHDWYKARENVTYTDGTRVQEGDTIRYHQAPGGLLPHGDWNYGVAAYFPGDHSRELHMLSGGRYFGIYGHVVEHVDADDPELPASSVPRRQPAMALR